MLKFINKLEEKNDSGCANKDLATKNEEKKNKRS